MSALTDTLAQHGIGVVHRCADALVVDKPSGMPSQAGRDGAPGVIEHVIAAGLVDATLPHRLDQPASGVLVIALSARGRQLLAEAMRAHAAQRTYLAVLASPVAATTWAWPLDGRRAVTHVEPLAQTGGLTPVRVRLETGRMHQIRRHAALAGAPIVGDRRYGGEAGRGWPRLSLHAYELLVAGLCPEGAAWRAPLHDDLAALWAMAHGPAGVLYGAREGRTEGL